MAHEPDDRPLFGNLVISDPATPHRSRALPYSLVAHGLVVALLIGVFILRPVPLPEHRDAIAVLLYDPPPPPPPPLPKGSALVKKSEAKPTTPDTKSDPDKLTVPEEHPKETELKPENKTSEREQAGVTDGSDLGVPEGMEGGVDGGEVGGVPGGVLGGVIGGTGDVVADYDQPPRIIRQPKPDYPADAAVKRIEGTVGVEFIIDADGHVRRAWVVRSIPALDAAAIRNVVQWMFSPAIKNGRPVASQVRGEVRFRLL